MSEFTRFMRENKKVRENTKYAVSAAFTDENGNPIEWKIKPVTTVENERFREMCTKETKDSKGVIKSKLNTFAYILKLIAASVVYPDLDDKGLQDSYDVMNKEDLILAMLDNPGEYDELGSFIIGFNGFNRSINDEIEQAKN